MWLQRQPKNKVKVLTFDLKQAIAQMFPVISIATSLTSVQELIDKPITGTGSK